MDDNQHTAIIILLEKILDKLDDIDATAMGIYAKD